jgi:hypothetical protein
VRELLEGQLARLQKLPLDLMQHGEAAERRRAVAIEHLQAAMEALELASGE